MSLTNLIRFHAQSYPDKPALITLDRIITYGLLAGAIRSLQAVFDENQLSPGAIVGNRRATVDDHGNGQSLISGLNLQNDKSETIMFT